MKNIFDFATKELSQDAFLRWLLENWNCEDEAVQRTSRLLLFDFLKVDQSSTISSLTTLAQKNKIDVLVDCVVNDKNYTIAIEDKTYSMDHDTQLDNNKHALINYKPSAKQVLIFYKTSLILDEDIHRIAGAGWKVYDIKRIYSLLRKLTLPIDNQLISDYVEKITRTYKELCADVPQNLSDWPENKVNHYLMNIFHHRVKKYNGLTIQYGSFRGNYLSLWVMIRNKESNLPYLEIKSRDIMKEKAVFSILIHTVKVNDRAPNLDIINKWKHEISSSNLFKITNNKKQLAKSEKYEDVKTIDSLLEIIDVYLKEYLLIFNRLQ